MTEGVSRYNTRMNSPRFVHLRLHSEYSVVDGNVRLDDAVKAAAKDGMGALALTDLANAFGLVRFYKEARGKGVKLQSYREGGLRDAIVFNAEEGAAWIDPAGRTRVWPEWKEWLAKRAAAEFAKDEVPAPVEAPVVEVSAAEPPAPAAAAAAPAERPRFQTS